MRWGKTPDDLIKAVGRTLKTGAEGLLRNRGKLVFNSVTALLAGAFTHFILGIIPYYPADWRWPIVLAAAILWVIKPNLGVVITLAVFLLPIAYTSLTLALVFLLVLLFISIIEIGALGPYGFLVLAGVTVVYIEPRFTPWLLAAPLLAGFLGVKRGIVLGAVSCFWVQTLAILGGRARLGWFVTGAPSNTLVALNPDPASSVFDFGWLVTQIDIGELDTGLLSQLFMPFGDHPQVGSQIGVWVIAAGALGLLLSRPIVPKIPARYTAVVGGLLVLGAGCLVWARTFAAGIEIGALIPAILAPAAVVALSAPVLEFAGSMGTPPARRGWHTKKALPGYENIPHPTAAPGGRGPYRDDPALGSTGTGIQNISGTTIPHEVFISYSSKDKPIADGICAHLETAGLRCWIAPRDVLPGEDWPTAIASAIPFSRVLVLIFSQNSNASEEVSRELSLAASSHVKILPFKIEDVKPEPGKADYLNRTHWLDALNPPTREQICQLIEKIQSLIPV